MKVTLEGCAKPFAGGMRGKRVTLYTIQLLTAPRCGRARSRALRTVQVFQESSTCLSPTAI